MDSTSKSFWDRRPWLGAILFAVVVSGVGLFLAIKVGERPHMRSSWSLVTEVHRGTYDRDAPWREDPVRVIVRVRTHDTDYAPIIGAQVALVAEGTKVISRGFTMRPEGHVHLPVPERFSKALFEGRLRVGAIVVGGPVVWSDIPKPKEGLTSVQLPLTATHTVRISVRGEDGEPVVKRGRVKALGEDGLALAFAAEWHLDNGTAGISGVAKGASFAVEASVDGHAPVRVDVPAGQESVEVRTGIAFARLSVVLQDENGAPLANHPIRLHVEDAAGMRPRRFLRTDRTGHFGADLMPGKDVRVVLTGRARAKGVILETAKLDAATHWRTAPVRLTEFPAILSGRVSKPDGTPGANAMVTVRPWARAGRVETMRANEDGVFEVRCAPFSEPLLVTAFLDGLSGRLAEKVDTASAGELALQVAAPGRIVGEVDALADAISEGITVAAVLSGVRDEKAAIHAAHVERDGSFELIGVSAGVYDVLVVTKGAKPRVIDGVLVGAGQAAVDARLATIRLR